MISVIVPTYNREECLYNMLRSINKQKETNFEVLVIDQSEVISEQKVRTILDCCKNVRYFHIDAKGRSLSKNFAIDKALGETVLFCDDDIVAEDNFLLEHLRVHEEYRNVGAVSCHLIEPHQKEIESSAPLKITRYGRFINLSNAIYDGFVTSLNGGNMSFKRQALQEIGYFEESLLGTSMLEEPDIAFRLLMKSYKIYFSSRTKVKHFPQHNGNITIKTGKNYDWLFAYFCNQYFFMIRNKRVKYFPFIFTYLTYRSLVEMLKGKKLSFKYFSLPVVAFNRAVKDWGKLKANYTVPWFTPRKTSVDVLKYIAN